MPPLPEMAGLAHRLSGCASDVTRDGTPATAVSEPSEDMHGWICVETIEWVRAAAAEPVERPRMRKDVAWSYAMSGGSDGSCSSSGGASS